MRTNKKTTLGLSLGTRFTGMALMKDGILVDWRVKNHKGTWSAAKCSRILHSLRRTIKKGRVGTIALKISHPSRTSTGLNDLEHGIQEYAKSHGIGIHTSTMNCLKKGTGEVNKRGLAKALCARHPQLEQEYGKEKRNRNAYYIKIFEAVCAIEHSQGYPQKLS